MKTIVPIADEVEQAALRFSTLAGNIKKERDLMREQRDTFQARLEQSESANNDLRSELESERATKRNKQIQDQLDVIQAGVDGILTAVGDDEETGSLKKRTKEITLGIRRLLARP